MTVFSMPCIFAVGIDPGLLGAVAFMGNDGTRDTVTVHPLPLLKVAQGKRDIDSLTLALMLAKTICGVTDKAETSASVLLSRLVAGTYSGQLPRIALEKVGSMRRPDKSSKTNNPKGIQGVKSVFTFGKGYGKVLAVLEMMRLIQQTVHVPPHVWKKAIIQGKAKGKEASISYCERRFPDTSLFRNTRCRTPSNGLADALCLAEYAMRNYIPPESKK